MEPLCPPAPLFPCEECNKCFPTKSHLTRHLRCHSGERPLVCDTCGKRFALSANLHRHEKTHSTVLSHGCTDETLHEDKIDGDVCSNPSLSVLEGHKMIHQEADQKFRCLECPYSTDHKGNLDRHLSTHSGERPHQCELCDKAFINKAALTRHLLLHTGEQPYVCNKCGKGFRDKFNCRRHEVKTKGECHLPRHERSHITDPKKKFRCTECPYSTDHKGHLGDHLFTHSGERPHQCNFCSKAFTVKINLKKHLLVHTGERPYACDTCGRGFSQKTTLQEHERTHSGE